MKGKFKIPISYTDAELFKAFGRNARYVFGAYVITFNNKDFSADSPNELFQKIKIEYEKYKNERNNCNLV